MGVSNIRCKKILGGPYEPPETLPKTLFGGCNRCVIDKQNPKIRRRRPLRAAGQTLHDDAANKRCMRTISKRCMTTLHENAANKRCMRTISKRCMQTLHKNAVRKRCIKTMKR